MENHNYQPSSTVEQMVVADDYFPDENSTCLKRADTDAELSGGTENATVLAEFTHQADQVNSSEPKTSELLMWRNHLVSCVSRPLASNIKTDETTHNTDLGLLSLFVSQGTLNWISSMLKSLLTGFQSDAIGCFSTIYNRVALAILSIVIDASEYVQYSSSAEDPWYRSQAINAAALGMKLTSPARFEVALCSVAAALIAPTLVTNTSIIWSHGTEQFIQRELIPFMPSTLLNATNCQSSHCCSVVSSFDSRWEDMTVETDLLVPITLSFISAVLPSAVSNAVALAWRALSEVGTEIEGVFCVPVQKGALSWAHILCRTNTSDAVRDLAQPPPMTSTKLVLVFIIASVWASIFFQFWNRKELFKALDKLEEVAAEQHIELHKKGHKGRSKHQRHASVGNPATHSGQYSRQKLMEAYPSPHVGALT
eukprot:GILI01022760.1.p1 GENE.GILI01022760.1~~GILI01022760.1.p1  ORF type:complete len:425 (-),score=17.71 GILI01022760.1:31-1305(-)